MASGFFILVIICCLCMLLDVKNDADETDKTRRKNEIKIAIIDAQLKKESNDSHAEYKRTFRIK